MFGRVFLDLGVRGGRMQKWSYEVVADRGWLGGSFMVQDMSYEGMLGVC